jgi:hypothetical protein
MDDTDRNELSTMVVARSALMMRVAAWVASPGLGALQSSRQQNLCREKNGELRQE